MARKGYHTPQLGGSGQLQTFVDNYSDGAIRALAQEPVQNAKDARLRNQVVEVEYRLLWRMGDDGNLFNVLTVTDHGTTGLGGKIAPTESELECATEEDRQKWQWYHFERLFDSSKGGQHGGKRGWGKSIFLHASHIPTVKRSAMMVYDTLLESGEYRISDMTIVNDDYGVRDMPLVNDAARRAIGESLYVTPDGSIRMPLQLAPLRRVGTRIVVPHLAEYAVKSITDGSLANWLEYLWWRPISEGALKITIVDEVNETSRTIGVPKWWEGDEWSSDVTSPGSVQRLHQDCKILVLENEKLKQDCGVRLLAIQYDSGLANQRPLKGAPDFVGIQVMRARQCIETYEDFDLIPRQEMPCFRGFVEFDEATERRLRDKEKPAHDGFDGRGIVGTSIRPYLKDKMHEFAESIGVIKSRDADEGAPSEAERRTLEFVFNRLAPGAFGDAPNKNPGAGIENNLGNPWDIAVLLKYPTPNTTRVNWGERIEDIRAVVNSRPESLRRNTRLALEWLSPEQPPLQLIADKRPHAGIEYALKNQLVTPEWVDEPHILCAKPGLYRIRVAVYEGKKLVAQSPRRVHVETDPPERKDNPFVVSISVENETAPGEKRIATGDILRLQINGRNRTSRKVSGQLLLRTREGAVIVQNAPFTMPGKPLGEDDRRHLLHQLRVRAIRGDATEVSVQDGLITISLEPGRRVLQAYLLDLGDDIPYGTHTLHFESEPQQTKGGLPFEPRKVMAGTPPLWELNMAKSELNYAGKHPLKVDANAETAPVEGELQSAFMQEAAINGLIEWSMEPLLEDESDPTNLETLRESSLNLDHDDAWDIYMDRLSNLANMTQNSKSGNSVSPIEYALLWRKTVAAAHEVLNAEETS